MAIDEISCREIETGKEFRNLGRWSWMLLRGKNNVRTTIITAYCPTVSAGARGEYIQQLEYLTIMKVQNDQRPQFLIYLNTEISILIHQGEQITLMGDWKSESF